MRLWARAIERAGVRATEREREKKGKTDRGRERKWLWERDVAEERGKSERMGQEGKKNLGETRKGENENLGEKRMKI